MLRKKTAFFLIIFIILITNALSQTIIFPLKTAVISAVPLKSEEAEINFHSRDNYALIFSIKEGDLIRYLGFRTDTLDIIKLKNFDVSGKPVLTKSNRKYKIIIKKGKIIFYNNKKKVWERDSPKIPVIDYLYDGKIITVLFKNGLLNIYSESGTLIYWETLDYKAKYIINVEKGIFIFSENKYYYYDKKKKKIKNGKLKIIISSPPIIVGNDFYIWGKKKNSNYFVVEKLSSVIGVKIDYDKPSYFKGDKIKLKIKSYNIEKLRITINLIYDKKSVVVVNNSKKKEFSIYLPASGKELLILFFKGRDYSYEIKLPVKVIDKEKEITDIMNYIYNHCFIIKEER